MFRKLQRNIVWLNVMMTAVLLIAVFGMLYRMLYANAMEEENNNFALVEQYLEELLKEEEQAGNGAEFNKDNTIPQNNLPYLILEIMAEPAAGCEIISVNIEEQDIEGLVQSIAANDRTVKVGEKTWLRDYKTIEYRYPQSEQDMSQETEDDMEPEADYQEEESDDLGRPDQLGTRIDTTRYLIFLDITATINSVSEMKYLFVGAYFAAMLGIFVISRIFVRRMVGPVQEGYEKQKQFIADASHELKTPLAVIQSNMEVLQQNSGQTIASQQKWITYMENEIYRMNDLVKNLLYLARSEKKLIKSEAEKFDISELFEDVFMTLEAVIYEKGIALTMDLSPDLYVKAVREDIRRVIMILADNAIKYTEPGGVIEIKLRQNRKMVTASVSNTGEGIPEEDILMLFERFYRVEKSRNKKKEGFGLGLAVAKAIIEKYDGEIMAESVSGERTTFRFGLYAVNK